MVWHVYCEVASPLPIIRNARVAPHTLTRPSDGRHAEISNGESQACIRGVGAVPGHDPPSLHLDETNDADSFSNALHD